MWKIWFVEKSTSCLTGKKKEEGQHRLDKLEAKSAMEKMYHGRNCVFTLEKNIVYAHTNIVAALEHKNLI